MQNADGAVERSLFLFFLWFPLCRGEAGLFATTMYGYFCDSFPLVPGVGFFSPLCSGTI